MYSLDEAHKTEIAEAIFSCYGNSSLLQKHCDYNNETGALCHIVTFDPIVDYDWRGNTSTKINVIAHLPKHVLNTPLTGSHFRLSGIQWIGSTGIVWSDQITIHFSATPGHGITSTKLRDKSFGRSP